MTVEGEESFKDKGNTAYQTGDYSKAVDLYTEGINNEPTNAVLFSNRSAAYLNLGIYDKAKRDAEMCIQLDEKWSKGWWRKGTAEIENQEYKEARSTFNEGLKHCPGDSFLVGGIEKANKYIAAVESVQGGQQTEEYDIDGPAQRRRSDNSKDNNSQQQQKPIDTNSNNLETDKENKSNNDNNNNTNDNNSNNNNNNNSNSNNNSTKNTNSEKPWPGTAAEEIERIKTAPNHYAILHVAGDATTAEMKKNYYTLARMLHPDRCQLDGAGEAMTSVSQAYDTLSHLVKKTLYDQFLQQTGGDQETPNQTYQEWESRQQPVEIPKWLSFILGIRGCGFFIFILLCIILLPFVIVFLVVYFLFTVICLPITCFFRVFFPEKYARMKEREEREIAKMEEEAQDRMFAHV